MAQRVLAHVPEKWVPVFRIRICANENSRAHRNSFQTDALQPRARGVRRESDFTSKIITPPALLLKRKV
jgi:hypothetical protein